MREHPGDVPSGLQQLLSELRQLNLKSRELLNALKILNEHLIDLRIQTVANSDSDALDALFTVADREFLAKISQACG